MKNIKNFIVLLFVLFTIPTIAQTTTTFTISPNPGTTSHPSSSEPYKVKKEITDEDGNFSGNTTWYTTFQAAFDDVKSNASGADIVFDGVNGTINYSIVNTLSCKSLKLSNGSSITLNNLNATVTNSVNVNSGSLKVSNLTCSGTVTVGGTLDITTSGEFGYLTVNGKVYTNNLKINNKVTVNSYKVLKVSGNYTGNGTKNFLANAIVIGINHNYNLTLNLTDAKWNFVGFPTSRDLSFLTAQGMPTDIWAIKFDHDDNNWNTTQYLRDYDVVSRGEGIFVFPDGAVSTTLNFTTTNADLNISHSSNNTNNGNRWYALANPFTRDISIYKLRDKNQNRIQGGVVYTYNGTTFSTQSYGFIQPLQGFFINIPQSNTTIDFKLDEIYYQEALKSETSPIDEITLDVVTDDYAVPVSFKHNEAALAEYDIFDANKMFGSGEVAEPYFVLGERSLCIEAANTLPYVAEMNIRSGEARNVKIVASDIPEQYEVILKDGEEEILLEQGSIYETLVSSGENADRFQVIINKKNGVSISDVENVSETSISQYNRNIIIEGGNNIHTEIFNMLGQKVYETSSRNFTLNNANAGTYVVKVKDGNSVNTTKIVIK